MTHLDDYDRSIDLGRFVPKPLEVDPEAAKRGNIVFSPKGSVPGGFAIMEGMIWQTRRKPNWFHRLALLVFFGWVWIDE